MDDKPRLKLLDCSLRLSVVPLAVVSLWLTVTDHQNNPDFGYISFSKVTGIKYMVGISAIAIGYALIGAICSWLKCLVTKSWVFFVSDQVMAYLMVTSWSVGVEFIYLAYKGDLEVTWSQACSSFGTFCTRLKIALVFQFFALIGFLVLALISAYRTFSALEAPLVQNYWDEIADAATTSS